MKQLVFFTLILANTSAIAQLNLVLNPSFENLRHCPTGNNQIGLAQYWNSIDSTVNPDSVLYFIDNGTFAAIHDTCRGGRE